MRILFVSANPHWTARLDLADELRTMQKSLGSSGAKITLLPAAQLQDLKMALRNDTFDIVHFSGHATKEKGLLFRRADGQKEEVSPSKLEALLKDHNIKLAVLNACDTDTTVVGIGGAVTAVIGTEHELDDEAAKLMTKILYAELAHGKSLNQAYDAAKKEIDESGLDNAYLPDVALTKGTDADLPFEKTSLPEDDELAQGQTTEQTSPPEDDTQLEGQASYDRYFYSNYLDEQISVLDRNIKLNRYVLWALVLLGIGMLLFDWGVHVVAQKPYGDWGPLGQIVKDVGGFLMLALGAVIGKATESDQGTPFLDWLMQLGQIAPLAIASLQYQWCVRGLESKREMTALKELVDGSGELSEDTMTRLHKILDQSLSSADTEFRDLREFLPEPIQPAADRLLDRTFGANIE